MRELEWKWIRVRLIEVCERKNEMGIDRNEWIENMDANRNDNQRCVVMRVMEMK